MDCSLSGSSIYGIFQARVLEWIATAFSTSNTINIQIHHVLFSNQFLHACVLTCFCCVWLCVTLWTVAGKTPRSMGFSRQEYSSGLPCPPPGDLPDPGIQPVFLMSCALAGGFFTTSATWEAWINLYKVQKWYFIPVNSKCWSLQNPRHKKQPLKYCLLWFSQKVILWRSFKTAEIDPMPSKHRRVFLKLLIDTKKIVTDQGSWPPESIEIDKRPDKKFRQGFIGVPAIAWGSKNT